MKPIQRALILAPHTDDGEFGCGGTISKMIEEKVEIYYVAFSSADKSLPPNLPSDTLVREVKVATKVLGIDPSHLILFDFPVRDFPQHRQSILEEMVRLEAELSPDTVFLPSWRDTHQDHGVIANEGFRAFKKGTMLGYELPWNNLTFSTTAFVVLRQADVERKVKAIACYESQQDRRYTQPETIWSLARTRGTQVNTEYAETFEVVRWLIP
jgi:N-acetylglucosamine malate deacetylase 1